MAGVSCSIAWIAQDIALLDAIPQRVHGVIRHTNTSVKCTADVGVSVERIANMARKAAQAVNDITLSLGEHSLAGRDVVNNVEQVARMTENLHATALESSSQARHLAELAKSLDASVKAFHA